MPLSPTGVPRTCGQERCKAAISVLLQGGNAGTGTPGVNLDGQSLHSTTLFEQMIARGHAPASGTSAINVAALQQREAEVRALANAKRDGSILILVEVSI